MIIVKKPFNEKLVSLMSLTLFALFLADAYLRHKDDIDESVARLKTILNKTEEKPGEAQAEAIEEGAEENAE